MRINQIEQFVTIAREGSINKAAEVLFISQPNLSVSMRDLENEIGGKLFTRSGRGVVLTALGSEFLAYAEPALRHYGILKDFARKANLPAEKHLSVASQYFKFATTIFSRICTKYKDNPFEFNFYEGSSYDVANRVLIQQADLGLIVVPMHRKQLTLYFFSKRGLEYQPLIKEEIAIILKKDHPLCKKGLNTINKEELQAFPLLIYQDINYNDSNILDAIRKGGMRSKIVVNDRASLYELLENTDGYTLGAHNESAYENTEYYSKINVLRLEDRCYQMEIGCLKSMNRPLSDIASEYLEGVKNILSHRPSCSQ